MVTVLTPLVLDGSVGARTVLSGRLSSFSRYGFA
jgi:hypothetical protein